MAFNFLPDVDIIIDGVTYNNLNYSVSFSVNRRSRGSGNTALININYLTEATKTMLLKKKKEENDFGEMDLGEDEEENGLKNNTEGKEEQHYVTKGAKVIIVAGYKTSGKGLIFYGDIEEVEENSSGGIEIQATEGERQWSTQIVNKSYTAGSTVKEIVKNIMVSSTYGMGVIDSSDYTFTRGFNAQGTLKSELGKLALQVNAEVRIKKNLIYFVKKGYEELETTVSADTGLKEIRKTENGYLLNMYLNNLLQENMKLNIVNKKGETIKTTIDTVSHYYSRLKFETTVECSIHNTQEKLDLGEEGGSDLGDD